MFKLIMWLNQRDLMENFSVVTKVGKKGVIVIPKRFRETLGLEEGSHIIIELREGAILVRPFTVKRVKLGGGVFEMVSEHKRGELELEG